MGQRVHVILDREEHLVLSGDVVRGLVVHESLLRATVPDAQQHMQHEQFTKS